MKDGLQLAYTRTARRFRLELTWDPETDPADQIIGKMIKQVQKLMITVMDIEAKTGLTVLRFPKLKEFYIGFKVSA